jgi:DNA-binding SARP family transcriptional activator
MSQLAICLLGSFQVTLDGQLLTGFETDKTRALMAYLAVETGQPHRREALAALFWPNRPESMARNNLRQTLYRLRRAIVDHEAAPAFLLITVHEIQLNPAADYWIDLAEFNSLVADCHEHHSEGISLCGACLNLLKTAVELYRGDFLAGFSLTDSLGFDWWQLVKQEANHHLALEALEWLGTYYEYVKDYARVGYYAQKEIQLEPWRESAHLRLMRSLVQCGQRKTAVQHYERCRRLVLKETGGEPIKQTALLYEQIRHGELEPTG